MQAGQIHPEVSIKLFDTSEKSTTTKNETFEPDSVPQLYFLESSWWVPKTGPERANVIGKMF